MILRAERGAAVSDGWIVANVDILARYPQLTAEGLSAVFRFAAKRVGSERTWDLPVSP